MILTYTIWKFQIIYHKDMPPRLKRGSYFANRSRKPQFFFKKHVTNWKCINVVYTWIAACCCRIQVKIFSFFLCRWAYNYANERLRHYKCEKTTILWLRKRLPYAAEVWTRLNSHQRQLDRRKFPTFLFLPIYSLQSSWILLRCLDRYTFIRLNEFKDSHLEIKHLINTPLSKSWVLMTRTS